MPPYNNDDDRESLRRKVKREGLVTKQFKLCSYMTSHVPVLEVKGMLIQTCYLQKPIRFYQIHTIIFPLVIVIFFHLESINLAKSDVLIFFYYGLFSFSE